MAPEASRCQGWLRAVLALAASAAGEEVAIGTCGSENKGIPSSQERGTSLLQNGASVHPGLREGHFEHGGHQIPGTVTFDTYVVNLDRRIDRCQCMAQQLASAPQGVYRQSAVDQRTCDLGDDTRTLYGDRNHTAEKSLFCSNYLIWQRAKRSSADFVVILEDDAVLAPGFWQAMGEFMQCSNFDYVTVDSWKAGGGLALDRTDACSTSEKGARLYRPDPQKYLDYWGTQAQIIRASFLDTLIHKAQVRGMGPMDVWWMMNINDGRAFSWQPGLVKQASKGQAPSGCYGSVVTSDINPVFFQRNRTTSESPPRLQCLAADSG